MRKYCNISLKFEHSGYSSEDIIVENVLANPLWLE